MIIPTKTFCILADEHSIFPTVCRKGKEKYSGEYRTRLVIVVIYNEMAKVMGQAAPTETSLTILP